MPKKIEWPGIATAVGLLLILTLIIVGSRNDFQLKEWQPLMAALIALGGGALAYRGAMAKVDFDRETYDRQRSNIKLSLYLRLHMKLEFLASDVAIYSGLLKYVVEQNPNDETLAWKPIRLPEMEEMVEAWNNVFLFPPESFKNIDAIRRGVPDINSWIPSVDKEGDLTETDRWTVKIVADRLAEIQIHIEQLDKIAVEELSRMRRYD